MNYYDTPTIQREQLHAHHRQRRNESFGVWLALLPFKLLWALRITCAWYALFLIPASVVISFTTQENKADFLPHTLAVALAFLIPVAVIGIHPPLVRLPATFSNWAPVTGDVLRWVGRTRGDRLNNWLREIGLVAPNDPTRYKGTLKTLRGIGTDIVFQSPRSLSPEQVADIVENSKHHLRCEWVSTEPLPGGKYRVQYRALAPIDPLADGRNTTPESLAHNVTGRRSDGENLSFDFVGDSWHTAIQGQTRSGKSVAMYAILGALAPLSQQNRVIVAGVDPTGILLAPWTHHPGQQYRALGLADKDAILVALDNAVAEMDSRIQQMMQQGVDKITPSQEFPALIMVMEEYPGLVAALETDDKSLKPADRRLPRVKNAVQRLIQEGAKAGIRVILMAQRMDASIVGGSERANLGTRITLRVDNADAVRMLHPDATPEIVEQIHAFPAGYGYLERPAEPPVIVRFDYCDYSDYRARILAFGGGGTTDDFHLATGNIPLG